MDFEQLSVFCLQKGKHDSASHGVCAMEAVAWLEGLEHSDHPPCTCPVFAAFVRVTNDGMPDDYRKKLIPFLPRLVGTVSPEHEQARAEHFAWAAYRVTLPLAGIRVPGVKTLKEAEAAANAAAAAATRAAAAANPAAVWNAQLDILDGALKIGPSGGFSQDIAPRVQAYRELVKA